MTDITDGRLSPRQETYAFRSMLLSAGLASLDRFTIGPMLVAIAATFHISVSSAANAATAYFIAYGLSQPVWSIISDRYGRVNVVRIALVVATAASAISAFAPSLLALSASRAIAGAAFGAVVPATITYIGDTVRLGRRQSALADMLAAMAVGIALATALGGVVADFTTWRVMFAIVGVASVIALLRLSNVEERRDESNNDAAFSSRVAMVFRSPWAVFVMVLAFAEGALVVGIFSLLPTIIEQEGQTASIAGLLAAIYGISVLVSTRLVKRVAANPVMPMAVGGAALVVAHAVPALLAGVVPLVVTAVLLGVTWALFHSSLQTWMTIVVPEARATCVALGTTALFLGSGLGTALGSRSISGGSAQALFALAAILSTATVVAAVAGRRKFATT